MTFGSVEDDEIMKDLVGYISNSFACITQFEEYFVLNENNKH